MPLDRNMSLSEASPSRDPDGSLRAVAAEWFARRDAGLSAAEEREFQKWLQADSRHGEAFARLDTAWSTFGRPVRTGAGEDLIEELRTRAIRRRRRRMGGTVMALVGLLVIDGIWNQEEGSHSINAPQVTAMVVAPARQTLADGTEVELKADARIEVEFSPAVRRVKLLQGEAMFSVAKIANRPFVVAVRGVEVQAVGTAFSVQLRDSHIEVLVTEGRVALAKAAATQETQGNTISTETVATLDAGNHCVLPVTAATDEHQISPVTAAEADERLAWRTPRLEFSGAPLSEAVALLNQHATGRSAPRLDLADSSLGAMRVSGIFRADNIDAFVLLLEASFGVKAEPVGNTIVLRRAP